MNFKIITYVCGHKYIWLHNTKRSPKCPQCNAVQKLITLWCSNPECNKKIITTPLAGRRIRCHKCSKYQQKERVQKRSNRIRNEKHGIKEEPTPETLREKEERETDVWYQECRKRLSLVVPETPILKRWMNETTNNLTDLRNI